MKEIKGAFAFLLAGSLGLACSGSGLTSQGQGGQGGSDAVGGTLGSGGSGGAAGSNAGGGSVSFGGRGGSNAGGGSVSFGGRGGSNAGGSASGGSSGTGGTTCPPIACPAIACLYGEVPNPDPCGCPICAPRDAGVPGDAAPDACLALPCVYPVCSVGHQVMTPPCGCPTCVPVDAGQPDLNVCPPIVCPAMKCAYGIVPSTDPCGCPTCAPSQDAGTETGRPACVGLDECTCASTSGCSVIAEPCYCQFPQCGSGACFCGGGRYIGCAPVDLASCDSAKARVSALCPQLSGPTFDNLCAGTDTNCITKCLNDVTSCGDVSCSFCEGCDCATDPYLTCVGKCTTAATQ
jgi:hypothetical protein